MTMCPAATKLSNILQFVKASYCEGEIDTERRGEAIDLCVLHICLAFPSTPIWGVKSSDPKLTVNRPVMLAKPADINQSDLRLVYQRRLFFACFARAYHLTQLLSCFWSLKKLDYGQMCVCADSQAQTRPSGQKPIYIGSYRNIYTHILCVCLCIYSLGISPNKRAGDVMIAVFQNEPS